jgi:hypothetical protein
MLNFDDCQYFLSILSLTDMSIKADKDAKNLNQAFDSTKPLCTST